MAATDIQHVERGSCIREGLLGREMFQQLDQIFRLHPREEIMGLSAEGNRLVDFGAIGLLVLIEFLQRVHEFLTVLIGASASSVPWCSGPEYFGPAGSS